MSRLDHNCYFVINSTMIGIMSNNYPKTAPQETENITKQISYIFCRTVEDGGDIDDLDELKIILKLRAYNAHSAANSILVSNNLKDHLTDEQIDIIRTAIRSYAKVSDDPIFQQVLDKHNW